MPGLRKNINWKYGVNQNIKNDKENITIISREIRERIDSKNHRIRSKYYYILCNECGYKFYKNERSVEGYCPCCNNKVVVRGVNDIATTHPEFVKYFEDVNDAYNHTYGSEKYVWCICPICKTRKYMQIAHLIKKGICCQNCGDGISYPEKFISNMFIQLNIPFIRQYSKKYASWIENNFYDFYLPDYNMIIEVHGMQHYKQCFSKISYEEQSRIDKNKKDLAIKNNISYYIEIDARYSEMDYIKTSVLNNEISKIIDLSNVNWRSCNEAASSSIVKEVCEFWESNKENLTTNDVSKHFMIDRCTVVSYLKRGTINRWCNYNARESLLRTLKNNAPKTDFNIVKEICEDWNNGLGVLELSEKYNFSKTTIASYLRYGNENNLCNYSVSESKRRGSTKSLNKSMQVNVYKDGEYILSEVNARILAEVSLDKLGVKLCKGNISAVCKRDRNHHYGFVFRYDNDDEFKILNK